MTLIEKEKAISLLKSLQAERKKKTCSRSSIYEAKALGYAIAVLENIKPYDEEKEEQQ